MNQRGFSIIIIIIAVLGIAVLGTGAYFLSNKTFNGPIQTTTFTGTTTTTNTTGPNRQDIQEGACEN